MMDPLAALHEENDTLREENRQLRALRLPPETQYLGLGFSRTERIVLAALMTSDAICTRDYLLDCAAFSRANGTSSEPKAIDVMICRLRKKLATFGFPKAIKTEWGEGWHITPSERRPLRMFFESRQREQGD